MTTASVMTYDSLVENIESYLERTDTATLEKSHFSSCWRSKSLLPKLSFGQHEREHQHDGDWSAHH